jgi:hypothetical protein
MGWNVNEIWFVRLARETSRLLEELEKLFEVAAHVAKPANAASRLDDEFE